MNSWFPVYFVLIFITLSICIFLNRRYFLNKSKKYFSFFFHFKKISLVKENDGYSIMICPKCLNNKLSFLLAYLNDPDVVLAISMENNEESNKKTAENQEENKEVCGKRKQGACCPLEKIQEKYETHKKPIFLRENWYDNLCLCEECLTRYKELDLEKIYKIRDENVNFIKNSFYSIIFLGSSKKMSIF